MRYLSASLIFIFATCFCASGQDSWEKTSANGSGTIHIHFYNSDNFISNSSGKLAGIEYDLLVAFKSHLLQYRNIHLELDFKKASSFTELYKTVKHGNSGEFGACSFSITEKRLKEVQFSPQYMPDIEVMISSANVPIFKDTNDFLLAAQDYRFLSVANTTYDEDLSQLKKLKSGLNIKYVDESSHIKERLNAENDLISFTELPNYFVGLKNGAHYKRQNIFKMERNGYGLIFPKGSDWHVPLNEFFNDNRNKKVINQILKKHLGDDINDLLFNISGDYEDEVLLLTKERELKDIELANRALTIENQSLDKKRKADKYEIDEERNKRSQIILISGLGFLGLLLASILIAYRNKSRANNLIEAQRQETVAQKHLLEKRHKEITDSINYAKLIQKAVLRSENHDSKHLPEHFIFFEPKEVVSGDFHWALEKDGYLYFAAADCTGHGVPGAFMSMMGVAFLNEICLSKDAIEPHQILNELREKVISNLNQTGEAGENNDGMDISICRLHLGNNELLWAGANNGLYIVSHGNLKILKADKQPISYSRNPRPFSLQTIHLEKGDTLYLTTDGYIDQFGGPNGKKFKSSQFKKTILKLAQKPMSEQQHEIEQVFKNWKGWSGHQLEQIDDVCVIGVRV